MAVRPRTNFIRAPGPVAPGLRIGLLGGSFNPAHDGHIHASEQALKRLRLDYVWWLVSPQNPLKASEGMAPLTARMDSARLLARHPRIIVTNIEEALGTSFTIDTVRALRRHFPQVHFVWLMGSDNLLQLPRWRAWRALLATVPVAVVARPGTALTARTSKAAGIFRNAYRAPFRHFSVMRAPAWTMLDAKRDPSSATVLREAGLAKSARLW